jgi:hypothetical protein
MESPLPPEHRALRSQRGGIRPRSGWFLIQYYKTVIENGVPRQEARIRKTGQDG